MPGRFLEIPVFLGDHFIMPHPVYFIFFFNSLTADTPQPIFTRDGSKDVFSHKEVPFGG